MDETPFDELVDALLGTLARFNRSHEATFRFTTRLTDAAKIDTLVAGFHAILSARYDDDDNDNDDAGATLASECLSTIRVMSRDGDLVRLFDSRDALLATIQRLANLSSPIAASSESPEPAPPLVATQAKVCVDALKAIANLIYNSGHVQSYYVRANVADTIIGHLKSFDVAELLTDQQQHSLAATMFLFDLRIMFLLTTFNRELRIRLDRMQVNTYLIEIVDKLIKERHDNDDDDDDCSPSSATLTANDTEIINEILKIIYNLTMELPSVNQNKMAVGATTPLTASNQQQAAPAAASDDDQQQDKDKSDEEEEAHLLHLVSVLRDLLTFRVVSVGGGGGAVSVVDTLHSNVINLLTNMPSVCYEELMTPAAATSATTSEFEFFEGKNMEAVELVLAFMMRQVLAYTEKRHNGERLCPVMLLLILVARANKHIRHYLRHKVLPALRETDLQQLPEHGTSMRNRLVRLMTDANLQVKRLSAQLLYVLCKESVRRLIKYTGYGNAAGLLVDLGILVSGGGGGKSNATSAAAGGNNYSSDSNTDDDDDDEVDAQAASSSHKDDDYKRLQST